MQKLWNWLEPVLALAALLAAAAIGLPYLAAYGHHNFNCLTQLLPCIVNTRADTPAGIVLVVLSLILLGGAAALAVLHVRQPRPAFLYILLLIAAAYWIAFIIIEGGFFVVGYQVSAVCLAAACLVGVVRQRAAKGFGVTTALAVIGISAAVWILSGFEAMSLAPCMPFTFPICIRNIAPHPPDAQDSLLYAVPIPEDASGQFVGFDRFTADELNSVHQGSKLWPLRFVNADTPSTGPDIVSVNPIDSFAWSDVALSSGGRCYAFLIDRHRGLANEYSYTALPSGSACVASAATRATVTGTEWPAN